MEHGSRDDTDSLKCQLLEAEAAWWCYGHSGVNPASYTNFLNLSCELLLQGENWAISLMQHGISYLTSHNVPGAAPHCLGYLKNY